MVTPDGMPLVWLGKLAGHSVGRTCGADLMEHLIAKSSHSGVRHYFYGGKPGVAELLRQRLLQRFPGASIVGTRCPPFGPLTEDERAAVAADVIQCRADVVWVGISSPRQEKMMEQLLAGLGVTAIGVGAAFDFHSGQVARAPRWMQRSGLEWLWRVACEPRRLGPRYLETVPAFTLGAITSHLSRGKAHK